ncbi:MAG: TRAP transporter substrate-binding protein DctP [Spirochaetota bacterium]
MTNRRLVVVIAVMAVIASLSVTSCAPKSVVRTWKLGHVRPEATSTDVDMKAFAEAVKAASKGAITIDIYAASQLGNYTVVQERVGIGDVEMQLAPAGTNVTKALGITSAPYLAATWDDVRRIFARDGQMMKAVDEMFAKENIKILGTYPKYFGGIALAKMPNDPKATNIAQGLKIRVPGIKSFEKTAEVLGYLATPIAFSEAFTAMQTGIVDGLIGSGAEGYWSSFRDLTKYYLPVNSHFEMWFLYMNLELYNKLNAADRKIVDDAAIAMEKARYKAAPEETLDYEKQLAGIGVTIIPYTDSELQAIGESVKAQVWPLIKDDYGAALFDELTR